MTATRERESILIGDTERTQAEAVVQRLQERATLSTAASDRTATRLPREVEAAVTQVLRAIAAGRTVTIGTLPEDLTTTVAAEQLGVSRPTVMKLIRSGDLPSFKVGAHHRVKTSDLEAFRKKRLASQRAAFDEMRELDDLLGN